MSDQDFGLPARTLRELRACFEAMPGLRWVKVYGSRAMGNYRPGSDVDLAFSADTDISGRLWGALDELPTPYLFDVTCYDTLTHAALRAHIDEVGRFLYQRLNADQTGDRS